MNLHARLRQREGEGRPLRVGVIGAGKFAAMYLAQVPNTPGVHVAGIADLSPENARANLERVGWDPARYGAPSLDAAFADRRTHVGEDWQALVTHPRIDIVIEATGNPIAAVDHVLAAFAHGKHVVMVTVEADALCGPALALRARQAGVVTWSTCIDEDHVAWKDVPGTRSRKVPGTEKEREQWRRKRGQIPVDLRSTGAAMRYGPTWPNRIAWHGSG